MVALLCATTKPFAAQAFDKNTGDLQNLVCFVRFADEAETDQESGKKAFEYAPSFYETLFNGEADGDNSVYAYFRRSSYGQK